jgi:hypothetical protein
VENITREMLDKLEKSTNEWQGHAQGFFAELITSTSAVLKDSKQEPTSRATKEPSNERSEVTARQIKFLPRLDAYNVLLLRMSQTLNGVRNYRESNSDRGYAFYQGLERRFQVLTPKFSSLYHQLLLFENHFIDTIEEDVFTSLEQASKVIFRKWIDMQAAWLPALSDPNIQRSMFYQLIQDTKSQLLDVLIDSNLSHSQLNIDEGDMELWLKISDARTLASAIQSRVTSHVIDFPWKRYTMGDVHVLFENLQKKIWDPFDVRTDSFSLPGIRFKTGTSLFPQTFTDHFNHDHTGFFAFTSPPEDYNSIDIITDYFQERPRMAARRKDRDESPLEWWQRRGNVERLVNDLLYQNPRRLLAYDLREGLFPKVGECTQFKVTLVKSVIEKLQGTRMLDFSAGWGDRLIGAIGTPSIKRYVAADPNLDLKPGHDEIIATLAPSRTSDFTVIYKPFQEAEIPNGQTFDLIFTSPPYFDFEIYTNLPGQSVLDFPKFEGWLVQFLLYSIRKAWNVLDDGGHMCIHITDTRGSQCCEPMNLFIQSRLPGSVYAGVLASMGRADKPRPMWVWRKDMSNLEAQKAKKVEAERLAKKYFTTIWHLVDHSLGVFEV